jgi:phosphotransferase system HPr (HPr) family protein
LELPTATRIAALRNADGLHFGAWLSLVKIAKGYESDVQISWRRITLNGKDMDALLAFAEAGVDPVGGEVVIEATGHDAEEAAQAIYQLVEARFYEKA